jgi:putative transposase
MRRFEIPEGWTAQAYRFALDPSPAQVRALESHCGAARFAFNHMLAHVKAVSNQRAAERSYDIGENNLTPVQGLVLASTTQDLEST